MLIKNYRQLTAPNLFGDFHKKSKSGFILDRNIFNVRKKALKIIEKGLEAIQAEKIIKRQIYLKDNFLFFNIPSLKEKIDLKKFKRIFVVGFGKGAANAAVALEKILKGKITNGAVIDAALPVAKRKSGIKYFEGDHPFPSKRNIKNTKEIIKILKSARESDLILAFIFGGGSALFADPAIDFSLFQKINIDLLKSGKNIYEINTIRKHIDKIKGGNLAKLAYPAKMYAFICSDVPKNDISIIASGPAAKDNTSKKDAQKIAKQFNLPKGIFIETPKQDKYFQNVKNIIFISNKLALKAMQEEAKKLGFGKVKIYSNEMQGEARETGKYLLKKCKKGEILLAAGETTVRVRGKGKGGRNQELVLGTLEEIKMGDILISINTDGKDNSEAAGAVADIYAKEKAERLGIKSQDYLNRNDSFHFFSQTQDLIFSQTGANTADLMLVARLSVKGTGYEPKSIRPPEGKPKNG